MIEYMFYSTIALSYIELDKDTLTEPDDVYVTLDSSIDIEKSSFWYQGEEILPQNGKIFFHVYEEDESIFRYILKDSNGNVLEDSSKTITLDSINPEIEVKVNDHLIEDTLYLVDKTPLSITCTDTHLENFDVYVDDVLMEEDDQFEVEPGARQIKIVASDSFGHETIRLIDVKRINVPVIDVNQDYDAYTLDPSFHFDFNEVIKESFSLIMYVDGIKTREFDCKDLEELEIKLDKTGDYLFQLVLPQALYLNFQIEDHDQYLIHFSNDELYLNMIPDTYQTNETVFVNMNWNPRYVKNTYLEIWNGRYWIRRDIIDQIVFAAIPGQSIQYYARAYVEDMFSRRVEKEVSVLVDCQPPEISLQGNGQILKENELNILEKDTIIEYLSSEKTKVTMNFKINDQEMQNITLNQAFSQLKKDDVLYVDILAKDEVGNLSSKTYLIKKEPIVLTNPIITTSYETSSFDPFNQDIAHIDHIWKVDESNNLIQHETVKKINDMTKPTIRFIRKNDNTIRIILMKGAEYSNDRFQKIMIDDKPIDLSLLKKDKFGNYYYDHVSHTSHCTIKAIATDASGNKTSLQEEFTFSLYQWLIPACLITFVTLLSLIVYQIRKRIHG